MSNLNGFIRKYAPWIISTVAIVVSVIITTTVHAVTLRYDVNTNTETIRGNMEKSVEKDEKQDAWLLNIQISLSRIEGKLDLINDNINKSKED